MIDYWSDWEDITVVPERAVKSRVLRARFSTLRSERRGEERRESANFFPFPAREEENAAHTNNATSGEGEEKTRYWREVA